MNALTAQQMAAPHNISSAESMASLTQQGATRRMMKRIMTAGAVLSLTAGVVYTGNEIMNAHEERYGVRMSVSDVLDAMNTSDIDIAEVQNVDPVTLSTIR